MKFLDRDEWRDCFEEVFDDHFGPALEVGDMYFEDLAEILSDDWAMTLWRCAFEDFLTQEFDVQGGKVAHLNYTEGKIDGSAIDQAAIDEQFTRIFGGGGTKFKRDDYKVGVADYVTLVGVRQHGQWQFMWQRRERHGLGATKMGLGWKLHKDMPVTL